MLGQSGGSAGGIVGHGLIWSSVAISLSTSSVKSSEVWLDVVYMAARVPGANDSFNTRFAASRVCPRSPKLRCTSSNSHRMKCPAMGCARSGRLGLGISIGVGFDRDVGQNGRRFGLLNRKPRYFLQLAFIEELEVFLLQRADGAPIAVANYHGHQHQI